VEHKIRYRCSQLPFYEYCYYEKRDSITRPVKMFIIGVLVASSFLIRVHGKYCRWKFRRPVTLLSTTSEAPTRVRLFIRMCGRWQTVGCAASWGPRYRGYGRRSVLRSRRGCRGRTGRGRDWWRPTPGAVEQLAWLLTYGHCNARRLTSMQRFLLLEHPEDRWVSQVGSRQLVEVDSAADQSNLIIYEMHV
jgi:hypothetical protein